jgi:hypothetical protein
LRPLRPWSGSRQNRSFAKVRKLRSLTQRSLARRSLWPILAAIGETGKYYQRHPERLCVNFPPTPDPFIFTKRLGILFINRHSLRIALQNAQDERCQLQICRLSTMSK